MKQLFINKITFVKNGRTLSDEHFQVVSGIKTVIWTQ